MDLVVVMSRLYRAKRQFTKPRLIEMTGVPRGATLEDLERTVLQRAHAPRRQGISPPLDHDDLDIVHHWLDRRKRDRKLRHLSRAVLGMFKGSDPADAVLRSMVAELARSGELVKARARDPRATERGQHAGGAPPAEPARRTEAPASAGAKPTPPENPRPAPDQTTSAPAGGTPPAEPARRAEAPASAGATPTSPASPRPRPAPDATTPVLPTRPQKLAVEAVTTPPPAKPADESVTPPAPPKPVVVSAPTSTPRPAPPEPAVESAPPPAPKPAVESEPTPAPPKRPLPAAILAAPDSGRIRARVERDLSRPPVSAAKPAILDLELAFSHDRIGESPGIVVVPELADGHELWFIGDMHGDLVSFEAALQHVVSEGAPDCTIVFLGDVVDDGFHSYELILRLFEEIAKAPGRYVLLAGNHDEALTAHGEGHATQFTSSVDPSEFSIWLNRELSTPGLPQDQALQIIEVARLFESFIARAPRALFFPGGLFAAHGGFPHSDLWDSLETPEAMTAKNCLNDFVWNRWSDQSAKFPNRMSSQSQFGARDFLGFCERATKIMGRSVSAMVRGHDHIVTTKARFERKEDVRRASDQRAHSHREQHVLHDAARGVAVRGARSPLPGARALAIRDRSAADPGRPGASGGARVLVRTALRDLRACERDPIRTLRASVALGRRALWRQGAPP